MEQWFVEFSDKPISDRLVYFAGTTILFLAGKMGPSSKLGATSLIVALVLVGILCYGPPPKVHATGPTISSVYISPTKTCCGTSGLPLSTSSIFSVNVSASLASGQGINGFDVRLNYSNAHSAIVQGVLKVTAVDYSNNLFATYLPTASTSVLLECINGIAQTSGGAGCGPEGIGQIHLTEFVLGHILYGPVNGELFKITFQVTGLGNSTFVVDQALLSNPNADPSNPELLDPQYVPLVKQAGIFGNQGAVAFFDFQPYDTSISPSLLPNQPVVFDASASFVANDSSLGLRLYSWNFGDQTTGTGATIQHSFSLPGNYTVSLRVWDNKNETGEMTRQVSVQPALGNLALAVDDASGNPQRGTVQVQFFNTSSSSSPFTIKTTDAMGGIVMKGLTPGSYYLTFSGQGLQPGSKTEKIIPGWTSQDTLYLAMIQPSPDYGGLIYLGTILAGLGIISVVIVYRKRKPAMPPAKIKSKSASRGRI